MSDKIVKKSKRISKSEASNPGHSSLLQDMTKSKSARASRNSKSKPQDTLSTAARDTDMPDSDVERNEKSPEGQNKGTCEKTALEAAEQVKVSKKRKRTSGDKGLDESIGLKVGATPSQENESRNSKKHRDGEAMTGHQQVTERSQAQRKKMRHRDLPFPDPLKDESLAEQSRKALSYAYQRFLDPESWKFNKARQNWLIRNVWSENAIPEIYVPLLTKYLADIKGSAREKLIGSCNSKISSIVVAPVEGAQLHDSTDADESSALPTAERARSLLQALEELS
ncbi:hypothetical protein PAXINDRAFT_7259 [Paxillus involutus ATCC 200175]|nr:hypothetical protein PAXINDRAFT_7259 [Paxillus involutus ATCC 200175]